MTYLAQEAPGLVVLLEAAGRTIHGLERRVDALEGQLAAEREERALLEGLLEEARQQAPDNAGVRPSACHHGETCQHDHAAPSDSVAARPPAT